MSGLPAPTPAGFLDFLRNVVGIPVLALPDSAPVINVAYSLALVLVNPLAAAINTTLYALMVYNLGTANIISFAPDQVGFTTFADLRMKFGMGGSFQPGIIQSTSDSGTSSSFMIPDALKSLTIADLRLLKTPWGQAYLALAQQFGTDWGVT